MKIYQTIKKNGNKGFSLVETLVAVMIFSVAIMAVMTVLSGSISNINNVKKKMVATYLAQGGIEYVRNMRDTYVISAGTPQEGWDKFRDDMRGIGCDKEEGCELCNLVASTLNCSDISGFTRTIQMIEMSSDSFKIISTVSWSVAGKTQSISFSEALFNWIQ